MKITGREPMGAKPPAPTVSFESERALGNVWALTELWKSLGFSDLRRVFRRTRRTTDVEALIRLMVLNRLCDPESKLGVLRWVQTVVLPDFGRKAVTYQQLLRSLDALMNGWSGKLTDQDEGVNHLSRKLSDSGAKARFYHAVSDAHLSRIPRQAAGYRVHRVFLRLPTADMAVERVAARVAQGGHDIPPQVIARRFIKGWHNFEQLYRSLVDTWQVFDNAGDVAVSLEEGERA